MTATLADFLKENGLTEAEAVKKLELMAADEEKKYYKALRDAWDLQDLKKVLSLLVSNQRDKGDPLSFIKNQAKLKMFSQTVNQF